MAAPRRRHVEAAAASVRIGVFYEHQLPRPWEDGSEQRLFQDALAQVELAGAGLDLRERVLEEALLATVPTGAGWLMLVRDAESHARSFRADVAAPGRSHVDAKGASMRFGVLDEHQLPRPWEDGSEQRLFQDALAQVEPGQGQLYLRERVLEEALLAYVLPGAG